MSRAAVAAMSRAAVAATSRAAVAKRMTEQNGPPPGGTPPRSTGRDTSWWHEASAPRRVENGIKARSKRGAIGEQWWSRRFVAVLESFGMSGRLARGRNYARRGQVMEFELTTGKVRARVQGSRPAPYQVRIGVLPLTTAQWRSVTAALGAQALFRAKLLAGEMPHEIEEVFAACGTPLFPRSARDLEMSCSCPDWGVPVQAPGRGLLRTGREVRRRPVRDAGLARPGPGGTARRAAAPVGRAGPRSRWDDGPGRVFVGESKCRTAGRVPGPVLVAGVVPGPVARGPGRPGYRSGPGAPLVRAAWGPGSRAGSDRPAHPRVPAPGRTGGVAGRGAGRPGPRIGRGFVYTNVFGAPQWVDRQAFAGGCQMNRKPIMSGRAA